MLNHEYIVMAFLPPIGKKKQFVAWPLHVTIMPWFTTDQPPEKLIEIIEHSLADTPSLQLQAEKRDFLGPYRTIPVTLIQKTQGLRSLHSRFMNLLGRDDWRLSTDQYVGENFLPHVTRNGKDELNPGTVVNIDQVQVIMAPMTDPRPRLKKLIGTIKLTGKGDD